MLNVFILQTHAVKMFDRGKCVCGREEVELLEYWYQISKLMECTSKQLIMKIQTLFNQLQYPHLTW